MSAHVTSRLSAFLDRELTETEASSVRQHLVDCEACATRLRELEGVDRAMAGMPVDAPSGYFDSFAARVRSRIETAPAAAAPGRARPATGIRLPTWAWAVAAALLLGVLLPRLPWDRERPLSRAEREEPAASPRVQGTPALEVPRPVLDEQPANPRGAFAQAREGDKTANEPVVASSYAAAPAQASPAPGPSKAVSSTPPPERADATPALGRPQAKKHTAGEGADRSSAGAPPLAEAQLRAREEGAPVASPVQEELRSADLEKAEATPAPPAAGIVSQGRAAEAPARAAPRDTRASVRAAPPKGLVPAPAEVEFEALMAHPAGSLDDLRRLRVAWRSFLNRNPEDPRVDEAQVRAIAVSVEIALRSRTPEDEGEARRSGTAYLAREEAPQKARVRDLLARLPEDR